MQLKRILPLLLMMAVLIGMNYWMVRNAKKQAPAKPVTDPGVTIQTELQRLDKITDEVAIKKEKASLENAITQKNLSGNAKDLNIFLVAYCDEKLLQYDDTVSGKGAISLYLSQGRSEYKALAYFRAGVIYSEAKQTFNLAASNYQRAAGIAATLGGGRGGGAANAAKSGVTIPIRYAASGGTYDWNNQQLRRPALASVPGGVWENAPLRRTANEIADYCYERYFSKGVTKLPLWDAWKALTYKGIDILVGLTGRHPGFSYGLALVLIALIIKIITIPLSNKQFKSMREMQAIQPLMAELQKKYKDDKEGMMREQMKLFKEHGVNPLGGCLPLLVQMPFLIIVYQAVAAYIGRFEGTSFLGIRNLADPNLILLIFYAISMYLSQKLTTPPSADPQQQQMQRMMTFITPVIFLVMFKNMSAAFILYWFSLNVFMTGHQYYILKKHPLPVAHLHEPAAEGTTIKRK
jgi:YidC/Oxa1 family membrane protein insertase